MDDSSSESSNNAVVEENIENDEELPEILICNIDGCNFHKWNGKRQTLHQHFNRVHPRIEALKVNQSQPERYRFFVNCPHEECKQICYNIQGLSTHLTRKHKNHAQNPDRDGIAMMLNTQRANLEALPENELYSPTNLNFLQPANFPFVVQAPIAPVVAEVLEPIEGTNFPVRVEDQIYLIGLFNRGLHMMKNQWRVPLLRLVSTLLKQSLSGIEYKAARSSTALFVLPGLIQFMLQYRQRTDRSIAQELRTWASYGDDCDKAILRRALHEQPKLEDQRRHRELSKGSVSLGVLQDQAEELADTFQLGRALRKAGEIQRRVLQEPLEERPLPRDEANQKIAALHPSATQEKDDLAHELEELGLNYRDLPAGAAVSRATVSEVLQKLLSTPAAGTSGWTFHVIKNLYLRESDCHRDSFVRSFTDFINACLQGQVNPQVAALWAASRAVLLPKNGEPGKYRPLGIGESLYRIMARSIMITVGAEAAEVLAPLQLGCGTPGGVEIAARVIQMALYRPHFDDPMVVVKLDQANAFNTAPRRLMFRSLHERMPKLIRFFHTFYSFPSKLCWTDGTEACSSGTGVHQGDPLAQLFYNVGIHRAVEEIDQRVSDLYEVRFPGVLDRRYIVTFICDDGTICVPASIANETARICIEVASRHNLPLRPDKCFILSPVEIPDSVFPLERECQTILGVPMGFTVEGVDHPREAIKKKLRKMTKCLPSLRFISPHSAFLLTRFVVNERANYLSRIVDCAGSRELFLQYFDEPIDRILDHIALIPDMDHTGALDFLDARFRLRDLRVLPLKHGGLGIRQYGGCDGVIGVKRSRHLTLTFCNKYQQLALFAGTVEDNTWPILTLPNIGGFTNAEAQVLPHCSQVQELNRMKREWYKRAYTAVYNKLIDLPHMHSRAAWLCSSNFAGSGRWLLKRGGWHLPYRLTPAQFTDAIRLRLLLPPLGNFFATGLGANCYCQANLQAEPFHMLDCIQCLRQENQGRHDGIAKELGVFIKSCRPTADIRFEESIPSANGQCKADLVVRLGNLRYVLDITVCEPGARTYRQAGSMTRPLAAACVRELQKRNTYNSVPNLVAFPVTADRPLPADQPPYEFIPFVIEATGRLGYAAQHFVNWLCGIEHTDARSHFYDVISLYVIKFATRMIAATRKRVQSFVSPT